MDLTADPIQMRLVDAVDMALTRTGDVSQELATIGIPELSAPQEFSGLGLGLSADIIVSQRLGRALVPLGAYRETVLALDLLAKASAEVAADFLTEVFKGNQHATTIGVHAPTNLRVDDDGTLWGESEQLPDGHYGLAVARAVGPSGHIGWYRVWPETPTCTVQPASRLWVPTVRLCFADAPTTELQLAEADRRGAVDAARVRQAAVLLGIADRAVAAARSFVNRRTQYGRQLIELQTVAHRLARLVGEADGWELTLHEAAWRGDRGWDITGDAARLLAAATEHLQASVRTALQLHGARGMVVHSTAATAYQIASVEGSRMGTASMLWREAGRATLTERDA